MKKDQWEEETIERRSWSHPSRTFQNETDMDSSRRVVSRASYDWRDDCHYRFYGNTSGDISSHYGNTSRRRCVRQNEESFLAISLGRRNVYLFG